MWNNSKTQEEIIDVITKASNEISMYNTPPSEMVMSKTIYNALIKEIKLKPRLKQWIKDVKEK